MSAPAQPTAPSPKVQVVSIQPELRVLRQASQAPVMIAARLTLTATMIVRNIERGHGAGLRASATTCSVLAMKASTSRSTGARNRMMGANAAMMM